MEGSVFLLHGFWLTRFSLAFPGALVCLGLEARGLTSSVSSSAWRRRLGAGLYLLGKASLLNWRGRVDGGMVGGDSWCLLVRGVHIHNSAILLNPSFP